MGGCAGKDKSTTETNAIYTSAFKTPKRDWAMNVRGNLRVMSWNVLTQKLTKGFDKCEDKFVEWTHRMPRIVNIIKLYSPDVVNLIEVSGQENEDGSGANWWKDFTEALPEYNAELFMKKDGLMGVATLYNPKTIEVVGEPERKFFVDPETKEDQSQNILISTLKHKATGKAFLNTVTHLKAKPEFMEQRIPQASQMVEFVEAAVKQNNLNLAIVTGDMNEEPQNKPIEILKEGGLKSCFEVLTGAEPTFTTAKFRPKEGYVKRTIDYVMFKTFGEGEKSAPVDVLKEDQDLNDEVGNPNEHHPSDHYAQIAVFRIE